MLLENGKISINQFNILTFLFTIGTGTLIATPITVVEAKQDSWLSALIASGFGLVFASLYGILAKRHPKMTLIEYCEAILGKWLGKTFSFLFFFYFLTLTAGLLRVIGDLITTQIMPETPIQAIEIMYILIIIYGVRLGLETFAKTSEMVFPWVILFLFLFVAFLIPQVKFENLSPFLEDGVNPALRGAFRLIGIPFLDTVILLMITPYVATPEKVNRALFFGTFSGGIVLNIIILLSVSVLGSDLTSTMYYPTYELAQRINIANFIQRIEVLSGGIMFISVFIKIIIVFYAMVLSLAQILNLNQYHMLTFPLGIIVISLSILLFPNIIYFNVFISDVWAPFALIYGLLIPLILLVIDTIKMGAKKNHQSIRR